MLTAIYFTVYGCSVMAHPTKLDVPNTTLGIVFFFHISKVPRVQTSRVKVGKRFQDKNIWRYSQCLIGPSSFLGSTALPELTAHCAEGKANYRFRENWSCNQHTVDTGLWAPELIGVIAEIQVLKRSRCLFARVLRPRPINISVRKDHSTVSSYKW